ncbi:MAG TPA: TetR/AcrR family transcriptional regulator C-terminal domain-containing protein [Casimicrobiaceae bacterium]|jgi:AcrR family transcriptional regulator
MRTTAHKRLSVIKRGKLTRERVLAEALVLLDQEGVQALSMRRLAAHLGVTPMALYNHVGSKRDLLRGIAEIVVDRIHYPDKSDDWREQVQGCFQALRAACLEHPGAVPLIESADMLPASVFRPMEITLSTLRGAGIDSLDALRAYYLLMTFTIGQISYQIKGWARGVDSADAMQRGRIPIEKFPNVSQASSAVEWDFDASFKFGLSIILSGLECKATRLRSRRARTRQSDAR